MIGVEELTESAPPPVLGISPDPGFGPDSESTSIAVDRAPPSPEKDVTSFVTRRGWNGKEGTGMYGLNGTLQDLGIAN